jgi:hypothetical protein
MDGYVTPKFWLSFAAKLLFCREHGEEGAWHHNIQPAYKAVGEHKEAQRLNNIDFGYSVFKLGANSSPIVGYAAKHGHAFPMRSIISPAPGGRPKHAYDLFTQFVQPLAALIWRTHQKWQPAECAAAMERFKGKECYMLTPDVGYTNCTTAINMATHAHYDLSQILTATLSVDVSALAMLLNREERLGGHYIVTDASNDTSVVFLEGAWGQLLLGPYHGILHGNMAALRGQRLLITFYCKTTILEKKPWEGQG